LANPRGAILPTRSDEGIFMTKPKTVVFQGEPGANSHLAIREVYPDAEAIPCATFEDCFTAITAGEADLGMIPIENSVAGRVADIHHLMANTGLHIIGEHFMPVRHQLLAVDIEDEAHNTTRFIILSRQSRWAKNGEGPVVTTFLFRVRNVPAALYKALGGFATNGVNMTKLESYMIEGNFFATQFYADVEGHPEDRSLVFAFEELAFYSKEMKILGVYPAHAFRATFEEA